MKKESVLICALVPYFLEKNFNWFEENLEKILKSRESSPFFEDNSLYLKENQNYLLSSLLRKLDEMGYEKVWEISEPGEFAQRGGILDIFPINLREAVRIDFRGNKIESITQLPLKVENESSAKEVLLNKLKSQKNFSDLKGLKEGDYLVHLDHGIGIYRGQIILNNQKYYQIEYAENDKLYVPLSLERKLSRYIGFTEPKISRLSSSLWQKTKRKVKKEAEKLAKELIKLYAQREIVERPPYLPENEIDKQLSATFPYQETLDQLKALKDIEDDLSSPKLMDRLICGDVGFGKTEIALRTMVRAVNSGYQAALLCPTTILANQHYLTFKERLKKLPLRVAILSRLQSKKEQEKIKEALKEGKIDIIVGTHRLLSKDIEIKNLGLLVIDDEHKFGVRQKEKLKKLRPSLDVLSLSATPIPRTLYLTLSSLRKISLIQTPPFGRLKVKTFILPFSRKTIKEAIERELERKGQVYYLHNRIETIEAVRKNLTDLLPRAKIGFIHAKLKEKELIKVMEEFQNKKIDVLVATTIIENGLDLPNVNTLIVEDATLLGLAQAYQIRGRIGRSFQQAYAYFFYQQKLTEKAEKRLKALKEAEELGSGYKIALKDLELRGAGNIFGKEQSGNINRVGLNLYCQLIAAAIEKIKKL
jgi:transcription-repair coupling factor (superfamily II helicase)